MTDDFHRTFYAGAYIFMSICSMLANQTTGNRGAAIMANRDGTSGFKNFEEFSNPKSWEDIWGKLTCMSGILFAPWGD